MTNGEDEVDFLIDPKFEAEMLADEIARTESRLKALGAAEEPEAADEREWWQGREDENADYEDLPPNEEYDDDEDDYYDDDDDDEEQPSDNNYEENTAKHVLAQTIEGEALIAEWGPDFDANLEHAKDAYEYAAENAPEFIAALDTPIEREDGSTYTPGNDPQWFRLAAEFGRLQAHRDYGAEVPASSEFAGDAVISARLDDLYALVGTDAYRAPAVQKEIQMLEKSMGDAPAIGSGARYA